MVKNKRIVKKKMNKYAKRRMIALLIIVSIILLVIGIVSVIKNQNKEIPVSVLFNNELLTLKKEVVIDEEKNIYFSKDDIQEIFDETIYYNEAEKELITTYNKHTALLKVDEVNMIVNDSNVSLEGTLQEKNESIYLPMYDLEIVYDIEIEYSEENNRIIIDSTSKAKTEAEIAKSVKVKNKKGWFKSTVEKVIAGEKVIVLEETGRYKKIRTSLGNIGYVKSKRITNENKLREDMTNEIYDLKTYSEYSNISGIYEDITVDKEKLNVVIPTFFYLDKNNKVLDRTKSSTATYANYTNWVRENNLSILPTLKNNESVSKTLLTYSQRDQVIDALYTYVVKYQYKGININFDTIDDINSFYRFIIEMTPRFRESGLIVSVTLNDNIDKEKILKITDYIIEK